MMKPLPYYADDRHALLGDQALDFSARPTGPAGKNLTISILSYNRSELTIRLIESIIKEIPQYAGRILIVDNGSDADDAKRLEGYVRTQCPLPIKLERLPHNHGTAGGRNFAFSKIETDWVLSLDNDIYLIGNPLPEIERDLGTLGCHFLNVPLLNPDRATFHSFGGHLVPTIEHGRIFLRFQCVLPRGADLAEPYRILPSDDGFLCSFLFGGASVINRHTFAAAGGFDAEMFVGFEDIEFSLRLFRKGFKIGSGRMAHFVHDHSKAASDADREYESVRYSWELLRKSARHFEAKHGYAIWDDRVEGWLADRRQQQGLSPR